MREELQRHLDGELAGERLPEALREEAEAWRALLEDVRAAGSAGAPAGLEARVMEAVRREGAVGRDPGWRRFARWWVRPRPVPVPPLAGALAAAALALLLLVPSGEQRRAPAEGPTVTAARQASEDAEGAPAPEAEGVARAGEDAPSAPSARQEREEVAAAREDAAGEAMPTVYVQFVLRAPEASSVALAGDFNGWRPTIVLQDPSGEGVWTARVPLRPGVHEYMFVIDGSRWVTDPLAERYSDDGFGNRNAVLAISPANAFGL